MPVTVDVDQQQMRELTAAVEGIKGGMKKAIFRASSRVSKQGRTLVSKKIREEVRIKKKDIDKHIVISKAGETGRKLKLKRSNRLSVRYFGARQTKKGVSFKIAKKGKRTMVKGAFMGPKPGQINIKTKGNAFVRTTKKRLPIRKILAVSPIGVVVKKKIDKSTLAELKKKYPERLVHEVEYLISQHAKKKNGA